MDSINDIKKKLEEEKKEIAVAEQPRAVGNVTEQTSFNAAIDEAKLNILKDAAANDENFVKDVKANIQDAAVKLTEVEKEKAELEKQNILFFQELKEKERKINEYEAQVNEWENKQKKRQYHYDGVKPIMEFVGIKTPMNLVLLYVLTCFLLPFYLISKLFRGTIGALIAGAEDSNRPKAVKGFIWTILGIIVVLIVSFCVVLALKFLGVTGLDKIGASIPTISSLINK